MVGLFNSPPTVSGIVVPSGSYNFDLLLSDFPIAPSLQLVNFPGLSDSQSLRAAEGNAIDLALELVGAGFLIKVPPIESFRAAEGNAIDLALELVGAGFLIKVPPIESLFPSISFDPGSDTTFQNLPPTTSGIVVVEMFPGAGVGFIPPVFINERLFPIFQGTNFSRSFPEENRRTFPVLPQFSILTPGD